MRSRKHAGVASVTLTGTLGLDDALSGFRHPVIWLVMMAFFISRGFIKTGLGARIAYWFMRLLGRRPPPFPVSRAFSSFHSSCTGSSRPR